MSVAIKVELAHVRIPEEGHQLSGKHRFASIVRAERVVMGRHGFTIT